MITRGSGGGDDDDSGGSSNDDVVFDVGNGSSRHDFIINTIVFISL